MAHDKLTKVSVMDIALANDEYYFPGLWSTVLSMLACASDASELRIHVIDTGITDPSWERLSTAVAKHPHPPKLIRKIFPREKLDGLNIPGNRSPLVYARLFLPELLECDRVLYLDSDLLIFKDLTQLEAVDISGYGCAAVINEDAGTLDFDLTKEEYESLNLDPKSSYFNAGLLYMNLECWRANNYTAKCFDFLRNHQFRLADQSALNVVMNDKILTLDRSWNRLVNRLTPEELVSPNVVIHYTTHKPWLLISDLPSVQLWKKFTQDTKLNIEPATQRRSIFERNIALNYLRLGGYGLMSLWHAIMKRSDLSAGYAYAFSYWLNYCANRAELARQVKWAADKIQTTHYGPKWLVNGEEPASISAESQNESSLAKIPIKGERLTSLIRNRGRSREFLGSMIQRKQCLRLEAILEGRKRLRISDTQSDMSVSLTSWPPRSETLPLVLLSVLEQSVRPAKVYVWLSHGDEGMIRAKHKTFFEDHGVEFHLTEDIVPHKKWLPILEQGQESPFVIIDDDTVYPRSWFGALVEEVSRNPRCIVAHRCHKIIVDQNYQPLPYADWEKDVNYDGEPSHYVFPTGCGGIVIQPDAISEDFRRRDLIEKLCPIADDIWLKAAYIQSGYKCLKSHYSFPCLDYPGTRESGLAVENVDKGANDRQFRDVLSYFDLKLD